MLKRTSTPTGLTRRSLLQALLVPGLPGVAGPAGAAARSRPWLELPATPQLPAGGEHGLVELDGTPIFFARFGKGPHVLLLHGGSANSNYFGHQIGELAQSFGVTVMDTRGHGRSPVTSDSFGYAQFARDVAALLKHLGISRTIVVGWSDGAITGIQLALTRPDLVSGLFSFGANTNLHGLIAGGARTKVFRQFSDRCREEYHALSPHPERWSRLQAGLVAMWRSQPNFTRQQLSGIRIPVLVADGEYDEIIAAAHVREIAHDIPGARLSIMEAVSHFALLQDPPQFNAQLLQFLFEVAT